MPTDAFQFFYECSNCKTLLLDGIRPFHYCAFCERAAPDAPETIDDQRRLHRMSLSDNLRRLARERIPTAPANPQNDFDPIWRAGIWCPF